MSFNSPLQLSRGFLTTLSTRTFLHHRDRIPLEGAALIVSNHRSFMDAPLLMAALERPIRFACHHYMGQVPLLREFVTQLGCLLLEAQGNQQQRFFRQARQLLQQGEAIGVFPEGASPMVRLSDAKKVGEFQRGFAHLALSSRVPNLAILPVAIAPIEEVILSGLPVRTLSLFDPSEPQFQQDGFHPVVIYRRINVAIGRPYWMTPADYDAYPGKQAKAVINKLTQHCRSEIAELIEKSY